ncbi:hypothetical protein [Myxococcus landrumensis]|uniref:SCP2 domain-containing protein n=1 Tax=Myxococcus landrumensis TaxID=2813577 RepID=A0ABX7N8D7_9BACT|nr:hypothetical protein [Myxococcus landrumus]QSQ15020.1 hypothetical protein JY572_02740 [Myxococcus landrumus]
MSNALATITPEHWARILSTVFGQVSQEPLCRPILASIGRIRFQLLLKDRPELSYWEEYLGDKVVPHLGIADEFHVQAETTFAVFTGTLLRTLSLMEAAADEAYEIRGDTEALMRCANLLPYVMVTFSRVVGAELHPEQERRS